MAMMITWHKGNDENVEIFRSAEILRSLFPLIIGGLRSTQIRVRQSTYRFLDASPLSAGMKFLPEKEAVELLKMMDHARQELEGETEDFDGRPVTQVHDYSTIVYERFVEDGNCHPETLRPVVKYANEPVEWVWHHIDGKQYPLGTEDVHNETVKMKMEIFLQSRVLAF